MHSGTVRSHVHLLHHLVRFGLKIDNAADRTSVSADVRELLLSEGLGDAAHMSSLPATFAADVIDRPARVQFDVFLDEHRYALNGCLDGLTEEQARRSLVPSRTSLLGLVKHACFVEKVWFDEAITCRSRAEIGIPATPDESFILDQDDTIATVQRAHNG
jgi:Protein of unknown function (DUF664)